MRYFMIDRVTEFVSGQRAAGVKNITLSDEILHDHFPDYPVFPGAFVVEAMAQLGGFLIEMSLNRPGFIRRAMLARIDQAKFHKTAEPGDQMLLSVQFSQQMEDAVKIRAEAAISGEKSAVAELTFVLKTIDSERIHEQRRYIYKLWTKHLDPIPEIL
jgi:3-hydroxyacyl-[acyl-carrier-protein] dehydratase